MSDYVEKDCCVEFQGRKFCAGGAVVSPDYLVAYPDTGGRLNDWHGNQIGTYKTISTRPAIFFGRRSWQGSVYHYIRATLTDGRKYSLRGFGHGMIAQGKRIKD